MKASYAGRSIIPATDGASLYAGRGARTTGGAASVPAALIRGLDRAFDRMAERLLTWQSRVAARRALESLDDRMLRDIGITRADVFIETKKPFWRD